jgi:hypothetical protein
MVPRPTIGDTMPPKIKPIAPTMAAAAPVYLRPWSIAIDVVVVNTMPKHNSKQTVDASYAKNVSSISAPQSCTTAKMVMPAAPIVIALSSDLNRKAKPEPKPIITELMPNITANHNSLYSK